MTSVHFVRERRGQAMPRLCEVDDCVQGVGRAKNHGTATGAVMWGDRVLGRYCTRHGTEQMAIYNDARGTQR